MIKIFISSVQKEFATERLVLRDYLCNDPLLRRFFEPVIFEDIPAADRRADAVYLDQVRQCEIYIGLLGDEYGWEDAQGRSPTQHEFDLATELSKHRLIFIKGANDAQRHPKMQALIQTVDERVIRRRFANSSELIANVYASLVKYLEEKDLIRTTPFDASFCRKASVSDLDEERIKKFLRHARKARGFPLEADAETEDVLVHLNLLDNDRPTNAAVLLFARQPQRFLISSEIKCAHFHGRDMVKPIPSYQVYKGTVFDLVDQAVDFVMSKINLSVGTRAHSVQAPVEYEMPREVVHEAIVNAVAHRDYSSNGSVQVMLFSDRLEIWNPGTLPPTLTLEKLRLPHGSVPGNPLLAEPLYLTKYIERMGTGTRDMIERCLKAGLEEPIFKLTDGFVTVIRRKPQRGFEAVGGHDAQVGRLAVKLPQPESQYEFSTSPVRVQYESLESRILAMLNIDELPTAIISQSLGQKRVSGQLKVILKEMLIADMIEYTIPDKPNSRLQKYRITEKGRDYLKSLK